MVLLITVNLFLPAALSQNYRTEKNDSLLAVLKTAKDDTNKVKLLFDISLNYLRSGDYNKALEFANIVVPLSEKIDYKKGIITAYNKIGIIYYNKGNYPEALKMHELAHKLSKESGNKRGIASACNNIGNVYGDLGDYPASLHNYFQALKIFEELKDTNGIASAYGNIGTVYEFLSDYEEALKNYYASLKMYAEAGAMRDVSICYNNIAGIYVYQGRYAESLKNYFLALHIKDSLGDKQAIATTLGNIGNSYYLQGDYSKALKYYNDALKLQEEIRDVQGTAYSEINIGNVYLKFKSFKDAEVHLEKAKQISIAIGAPVQIRDAYDGLASVDAARGKYEDALQNYKMYIAYRDSLNNEETTRKTVQSQMQYDFDKKELLAKAEQKKKDFIISEDKRKQKIVLWFVISGFGLVILVAVFIFRSLRLNKKKNRIITLQKEMVERQKHIVEEKQKEVLDSIRYAKRIQTALITSEKYIAKKLTALNK